MSDMQELVPARELVTRSEFHFPNETAAYREARTALLVEEIELRRQLERVSAQRRALPAGGEIPQNFEMVSESGPIHFADLFGEQDTLLVYSMMYGPARKAPCPMCTSFLSAWNGVAINLRQRVALAVTARSPIERLVEYKKERGLAHLPFVSDVEGGYTRSYVSAKDEDIPGLSVFRREGGVIRHFYSGEMSGGTADPGQDPRGAPEMDPLWTMLDLTPEGRGTDWYPKLSYVRE